MGPGRRDSDGGGGCFLLLLPLTPTTRVLVGAGCLDWLSLSTMTTIAGYATAFFRPPDQDRQTRPHETNETTGSRKTLGIFIQSTC